MVLVEKSHHVKRKMQPSDSERLKIIRNDLHSISQQKFADLLGIPVHKIKDIESGKTKFAVDLASLIEEKFHYDFRWLLTGEGERRRPSPGAAHPYNDTAETSGGQVAAPKESYDLHGGWRPKLEGEDYELLGQVYDILKHDTIYRQALISNIRAFHAAQLSGVDLQKTRAEVAALAGENKDLKTRLEILEGKVVELDRRSAGHDRIRQDDSPDQKDDLLKKRAM